MLPATGRGSDAVSGDTLTWNIVRFSVAAVCVVPFWLSLRRLQRG